MAGRSFSSPRLTTGVRFSLSGSADARFRSRRRIGRLLAQINQPQLAIGPVLLYLLQPLLPVAAGYLQRVLYRNPVFTQQRTFGSSGWPLRDAGIDYDQALCPLAEDMVARTLLTVGINENFDAADVASAIDALTGALDALAAAAPGLGER